MGTTWKQQEDNVETTWGPRGCGNHMGTRWRQHGDLRDVETTWGQHEDNVETTWGQHGDHGDVETMWGQHGDHGDVVTIW